MTTQTIPATVNVYRRGLGGDSATATMLTAPEGMILARIEWTARTTGLARIIHVALDADERLVATDREVDAALYAAADILGIDAAACFAALVADADLAA